MALWIKLNDMRVRVDRAEYSDGTPWQLEMMACLANLYDVPRKPREDQDAMYLRGGD